MMLSGCTLVGAAPAAQGRSAPTAPITARAQGRASHTHMPISCAARPNKTKTRGGRNTAHHHKGAANILTTSKRNVAAAAKGGTPMMHPIPDPNQAYWEEEDIWEWSLNWNRAKPNLLVGTCPCSKGDVDRLMNEAGIEAFVCMQTDKELEALDINFDELYYHMLDRGAVPSRIPIDPMNEYHQAKEVPEVVRVLIAHMNAGRRTYVYGTAGVNRTAYALVLMLCFFDKMEMEDAIVQAAKLRPQAKNNTDLWLEVHKTAMQEEPRGKTMMRNYRSLCYPWGKAASMDQWFKEFLRLVDDYKRANDPEREPHSPNPFAPPRGAPMWR